MARHVDYYLPDARQVKTWMLGNRAKILMFHLFYYLPFHLIHLYFSSQVVE